MARRVPLAWSILTHDKTKLFWSLVGVAFAVFLMFVQMGFMNAAYDSATLLLTDMNADLYMVSRDKVDMAPETPFPLRRVIQARGFEGVAEAHPVYVRLDVPWKNAVDGQVHPIRVVAVEPGANVWRDPRITEAAAGLGRPGICIVDTMSRPHFGNLEQGVEAELKGRRIRVAGTFELGTGLGVDGTAILSPSNFVAYVRDPTTGQPDLEDVELGAIRLESDADADAVVRALREGLREDVAILSADELVARVHDFWRKNQPVGAVFSVGMIVGFLIGVIICYQILFTEIADHLPQYATLKAIGYGDRYLITTVLRQAVYLALGAFLAGAAVSWLAYVILADITGLRMLLTPGRAVAVLAMTLAMCLISALLAVRKVLRSDPAEVF